MASSEVTTQDILQILKNKQSLPMQNLGMPGVSEFKKATGMVGTGAVSVMKDLYSRMHRGVTQGPYSSSTGEYDPSIGLLAPEMMLPAFGRALGGIGIVGGKVGKPLTPGHASELTQKQLEMLKNLHSQGHVSVRALAKEIENVLGEGEIISPYLIRKSLDKMGLKPYLNPVEIAVTHALLKGENLTIGSKAKNPRMKLPTEYSISERQFLKSPQLQKVVQDLGAMGMTPEQISTKLKQTWDYDIITPENIKKVLKSDPGGTFGVFGGRGGRGGLGPPKAEGAAENINWLQSQRPVDRQWVEQWAKDADVPIRSIINREGTDYISLEPFNIPKSNAQIPTVRIPHDVTSHIGRPVKNTEVGSRFDTGLGTEPITPGYNSKFLDERGLINQAGMSYANPEALDAALRLRLSKAPHPIEPGTGNWLVSPDMAPRTKDAVKILERPIKPDPRQLELLTSGFTPAQILEALRQQNNAK